MAKRKPDLKTSKRHPTPETPGGCARSDGLVLRVGTNDMDQVIAKRLAKKIVRQHLPADWVVEPMGVESRDFSVRPKAGTKSLSTPKSFELAYRLRDLRDVEDCEPAVYLPTEGSTAVLAERPLASASSGRGNVDLACSQDADWALQMCRIPQAWDLMSTGSSSSQGNGIVVGHPDTGYTKHPQYFDTARVLAARGFDFETGARDPRDPLTGPSGGHGTSTGSVIISAVEDAAVLAVTGAAPRASLVPLRVTNNVVLLSFARLAEAIRYAADNDFHVISISLGGPYHSRFLDRAVTQAISKGLIIVSAAGNVWPFVVYPAMLDEVIAVAACNCRRELWDDSASGNAVDITAPGESVWRALSKPSGQFVVERGSGTSFSTAITAGAAAMWLAWFGRDKLIQRFGRENIATVFKESLLRHGFERPVGWDTANHGVGILDAFSLLSAPLPTSVPSGGLRALSASVAPRVRNQFDDIAEVLPDLKPSELRVMLSAMLQVEEQELNAALRNVGEEIAYLAVTDLAFRRSLLTAGKSKPQRRTNALATGARPSNSSGSFRTGDSRAKTLLPSRLSRTLRTMTK